MTTRVGVGLDIGGTKVLGAVVDSDGRILDEYRVPSPTGSWQWMLDAITTVVGELRVRHPEVATVGIGAAGMVDLDGMIHYAPNVLAFRKTPVRDDVAATVGLPTVVDNDANVAAYAELRFGAARGMTDAVVITLGTGIGGGVLVGGKVLRGAHGFAAEVGHFQIDPHGPMCACGERGHWEAMASGTALGHLAQAAATRGDLPSVLHAVDGEVDTIRGPHVSEAARAGAADALALVDAYAFNVAIGLVGLANIFDPAVIAIAGGLVNDDDLYLAPITAHFLGHIEGHDYRPTPSVVPAQLGERAGVIGAAAVGLDAASRSPREWREERGMKVGLTLPSFTEDPETPLRVAAAAEAAGVDGVFVYDHLFRVGRNGEMRPALECMALLGATAVETRSITLGTLVVRATLRPPTTLATALDTVVRIAGPRLVVGLGAGDEESRSEMETFGLPMGTEEDRVKRLRVSLREIADRPYPTWVGGRARHVGLVAAESAKGWNRWGQSPEEFAVEAAEVASLVRRLNPDPSSFTTSWGGLVVLGADDDAAAAKAKRLGAGPGAIVGGPRTVAQTLARYRDAGADWVILGPIDSEDPDNATIIGQELRSRLR